VRGNWFATDVAVPGWLLDKSAAARADDPAVGTHMLELAGVCICARSASWSSSALSDEGIRRRGGVDDSSAE